MTRPSASAKLLEAALELAKAYGRVRHYDGYRLGLATPYSRDHEQKVFSAHSEEWKRYTEERVVFMRTCRRILREVRQTRKPR